MPLDTEQRIFIICASLAESVGLGDPFDPHRSPMTTLFNAPKAPSRMACRAKALVLRSIPKGTVDG
jgi:hypothetical protein